MSGSSSRAGYNHGMLSRRPALALGAALLLLPACGRAPTAEVRAAPSFDLRDLDGGRATLASFNIPEAGLLLIIGIDQFLDMGRSATNVIGNTLATAVVAKWEGEKLHHPLPEPALKPQVA